MSVFPVQVFNGQEDWIWWNVKQKALKELYIIFIEVVLEILYSMFKSNFETYMLIISHGRASFMLKIIKTQLS